MDILQPLKDFYIDLCVDINIAISGMGKMKTQLTLHLYLYISHLDVHSHVVDS